MQCLCSIILYTLYVTAGVDYLRALKTDKARLDQEADGLRQEMDRLNNAIRCVSLYHVIVIV